MPSITVKDVDLHYALSGPEGAPVVAFSNSIGTTLEMWDAQAEALYLQLQNVRQDEIAKALGISQPSVHQRLQAAGWAVLNPMLQRFETVNSV